MERKALAAFAADPNSGFGYQDRSREEGAFRNHLGTWEEGTLLEEVDNLHELGGNLLGREGILLEVVGILLEEVGSFPKKVAHQDHTSIQVSFKTGIFDQACLDSFAFRLRFSSSSFCLMKKISYHCFEGHYGIECTC